MTTNTKKTNRQKNVQQIKQFRGKVTSLMDRGFEYIGMAGVSEIPSVSSSEMLKGEGAIGGLPIQGTFNIFDSKQSIRGRSAMPEHPVWVTFPGIRRTCFRTLSTSW